MTDTILVLGLVNKPAGISDEPHWSENLSVQLKPNMSLVELLFILLLHVGVDLTVCIKEMWSGEMLTLMMADLVKVWCFVVVCFVMICVSLMEPVAQIKNFLSAPDWIVLFSWIHHKITSLHTSELLHSRTLISLNLKGRSFCCSYIYLHIFIDLMDLIKTSWGLISLDLYFTIWWPFLWLFSLFSCVWPWFILSWWLLCNFDA